MFILRQSYNRLVSLLNQKEHELRVQDRILLEKNQEIHKLRDRVRALEHEKIDGSRVECLGGLSVSLELPADVARVLPDHFGGKVLQHEATKVVVLDKNGNGKVAYTAKKADKGFSYLLVREK